jgi:hypothetical protein
MRKILFVLMLVTVCATAAFAFDPEELNKITFLNSTGGKIEMIFLSPGDSDFWGPDIVGADYFLKDGGSLGYYVHYPESTFKFDIMATDDKGNRFELRDFTLTDGKEQTVTLAKKSLNKSAPDFNLMTVHVLNSTGKEMEYLFISPDDSDAWGADLLDENTTLADGDTHSIVVPVGKTKVKYNLMAVDNNNDEYTFNVTLDPKKGDEFDVTVDATDQQE